MNEDCVRRTVHSFTVAVYSLVGFLPQVAIRRSSCSSTLGPWTFT